jgi:hypothetical protein
MIIYICSTKVYIIDIWKPSAGSSVVLCSPKWLNEYKKGKYLVQTIISMENPSKIIFVGIKKWNGAHP